MKVLSGLVVLFAVMFGLVWSSPLAVQEAGVAFTEADIAALNHAAAIDEEIDLASTRPNPPPVPPTGAAVANPAPVAKAAPGVIAAAQAAGAAKPAPEHPASASAASKSSKLVAAPSCSVEFDNAVYTFGPKSAKSHDALAADILRYDQTEKQWKTVHAKRAAAADAKLSGGVEGDAVPCARKGHTCAVEGQRMLVFGGVTADSHEEALNDLWEYGLLNNQWKLLSGTGKTSSGASISATSTKPNPPPIVNGQFQSGSVSMTAWGTPTYIMPTRVNSAGVVDNTRQNFWIFGGRASASDDQLFSDLYRYHFGDGLWYQHSIAPVVTTSTIVIDPVSGSTTTTTGGSFTTPGFTVKPGQANQPTYYENALTPKPLARWPGARERHSCVVTKQNKLVCYGGRGYAADPKYVGVLSDVWTFDLTCPKQPAVAAPKKEKRVLVEADIKAPEDNNKLPVVYWTLVSSSIHHAIDEAARYEELPLDWHHIERMPSLKSDPRYYQFRQVLNAEASVEDEEMMEDSDEESELELEEAEDESEMEAAEEAVEAEEDEADEEEEEAEDVESEEADMEGDEAEELSDIEDGTESDSDAETEAETEDEAATLMELESMLDAAVRDQKPTPGSRAGHIAAYDSHADHMWMFGGEDALRAATNDLWALRMSDFQWIPYHTMESRTASQVVAGTSSSPLHTVTPFTWPQPLYNTWSAAILAPRSRNTQLYVIGVPPPFAPPSPSPSPAPTQVSATASHSGPYYYTHPNVWNIDLYGRIYSHLVDVCSSAPCANGGHCINTIDRKLIGSGVAYKCDCPNGFTGSHCQFGDHLFPQHHNPFMGNHYVPYSDRGQWMPTETLTQPFPIVEAFVPPKVAPPAPPLPVTVGPARIPATETRRVNLWRDPNAPPTELPVQLDDKLAHDPPTIAEARRTLQKVGRTIDTQHNKIKKISGAPLGQPLQPPPAPAPAQQQPPMAAPAPLAAAAPVAAPAATPAHF